MVNLFDSSNSPTGPSTLSSGFQETDEEFLNRQFQQSIDALERVHALSPGEFESLIRTPARSDEEKRQRSMHHEDIARRALIAAQKHQLAEEEFNIWSGRRKEAGQPVKFRFERAFANACTPQISCKRGALTGIIRSYVRLQDELINDLMAQGEYATTADDLIRVQEEARRLGFLEFEVYTCGEVDGWPCFPRSTGRFRGSTRLRQFFEQRQAELPLPKELLPVITDRFLLTQQAKPAGKKQRNKSDGMEKVAPLTSIFSRVARLFKQ